MSIHIGHIVKELVKAKGLSVVEFAEMINYSRRNIYDIFEKETMDTGLLLKINKVLGENLFRHYMDDPDQYGSDPLLDLERSAKIILEEVEKIRKLYNPN